MAGRLLSAAAIFALAASAAASNATTYNGQRNFGGGLTGALRIETDGTLGVLNASNILTFKLTLSGLGDAADNYGAHPVIIADVYNPLVLQGSSLSATQGKLLFDFDQGGGVFGVQSEFLELDPEFGFFRAQSGVQLLGSVPEPGSWVMLIAGFGLTGSALRRRRAALFSN